MSIRAALVGAPLVLILCGIARAGEFVDLGTPVRQANVMTAFVGPDADGRMTKIYAHMAATGEITFLLQIDPATGEVSRYDLP